MLDLALDVMQLHVYLVPSWTAPSGRDLIPPAGSRTTRAAMTSPCASQKQTSHSEGFTTRTNVLCPSELHKHARVENPSSPNPATQPGLCPSAGSATSTAGVPGPGFTPAAEHMGVSCVARHGPHARCCANPARSPLKLQPLLGPCLSFVAVVVSSRHTRSNSRV